MTKVGITSSPSFLFSFIHYHCIFADEYRRDGRSLQRDVSTTMIDTMMNPTNDDLLLPSWSSSASIVAGSSFGFSGLGSEIGELFIPSMRGLEGSREKKRAHARRTSQPVCPNELSARRTGKTVMRQAEVVFYRSIREKGGQLNRSDRSDSYHTFHRRWDP